MSNNVAVNTSYLVVLKGKILETGMATHWQGSFRRGAFAATAVAGLAASTLFPSQALAQTKPTPAAYQGTVACAKFAKGDPTLERAVQCEARELDRRIADAKKRGSAADLSSSCTDYLVAGVKGGRFTKSAALAVAKGKLTAANACEVARSFGYGQKAELSYPSVR